MRCVSYTRSTSSQPMLIKQQSESITQQNEKIQQFVRKRGWKIDKKYSDRKKDSNEDSAFQEMKEDGMNRKFDCVVISSVYYCGKEAILALDLFELVFLPAGIHFAIVDDDICSAEMTAEEAEEYLNRKRKQVHSEKESVVSRNCSGKRKYLNYGYLYKEDSTELVIDDNVADNIREIFRLASENKTCKEICHILDEREIEPAHVYMKHLRGKPLKPNENGKWKDREVCGIIINKLYIGKWERTIKGEKVVVDCPSIVDEDIFNKIRKQRVDRKYGNNGRGGGGGKPTPFSKKIIDCDTGNALVMKQHPCTKEKIFRMNDPKQINAKYEKMWISYSEVEKQVWSQLLLEKKKAQMVVEALHSDTGIQEKDVQQQKLIKEAKEIFDKMLELEKRRHLLRCQQQEVGNDNSHIEELDGIDETFALMDTRMTDVEEKIAEGDRVLSDQNPWIKTFANLDISQGITMELSKKCIECIKCVKFQYVVTEFKHTDWRDKLPQEWFGGLS